MSLINNLRNVDLRSIAYRPSNDTLYGLDGGAIGQANRLHKYNSNGEEIGQILLSQPIGLDMPWGLDWQMMLASDGQLAVIGTEWVGPPTNHTGIRSRLYLINPDTGVVSYQGELPVPEPAVAVMLLAAAGLLLRRTRVG
jgi:hypothetical protein